MMRSVQFGSERPVKYECFIRSSVREVPVEFGPSVGKKVFHPVLSDALKHIIFEFSKKDFFFSPPVAGQDSSVRS